MRIAAIVVVSLSDRCCVVHFNLQIRSSFSQHHLTVYTSPMMIPPSSNHVVSSRSLPHQMIIGQHCTSISLQMIIAAITVVISPSVCLTDHVLRSPSYNTSPFLPDVDRSKHIIVVKISRHHRRNRDLCLRIMSLLYHQIFILIRIAATVIIHQPFLSSDQIFASVSRHHFIARSPY